MSFALHSQVLYHDIVLVPNVIELFLSYPIAQSFIETACRIVLWHGERSLSIAVVSQYSEQLFHHLCSRTVTSEFRQYRNGKFRDVVIDVAVGINNARLSRPDNLTVLFD
jgi:hypothetical protein